MIKSKLLKLREFDKITQFRLINAFIIAIGMNLFYPILIDLKGEYLLAYAISMFLILFKSVSSKCFVNIILS